MKKVIMILPIVMLSAGIALAGGDKVRGEKGSGNTSQELCGSNDDCAGDPYWWPEL